jgi:uncharacterized protein
MRIGGLYIYPVKSCRGIAVDRALITPNGLEWDRHWMITRPDGRFVTQRELPRLALVRTSLTAQALCLEIAGKPPLHVSLEMRGSTHSVRIWRDTVRALDCGADAASWLQDALGESLRLVAFDSNTPRYSNPEFTAGVPATTQFSDGYALLVISEASLADLNSRLPGPALPMNRFRPNVVLCDVPAFAEDSLRDLEFGDVHLRIVKPCVRCSITTTDQATAQLTGDEPLSTLKAYRFDRTLLGVTFGQNAIVVGGRGASLAVGMEATRAS